MSVIHVDPSKAAVLLGLLALGGCQSPAVVKPTPEQINKLEEFSIGFRVALASNARVIRSELLDGQVKLRVKINRRNEVVFCEAEPYSAAIVPPAPLDPRLSAVASEACWNTLFPIVPSDVFDADGTAEIVAPLIFSSDEDTEELKLKRMGRVTRYAQSRFFWEQTLRNQPASSIGYADFRYVADAKGQVQGCLVNLRPSPQRPDAFKLDGDLQARLSAQCKQMNLRQLPGFTLDPHGVAEGTVRVEYMPWKGGPQPL
ncbi:hypothetical protein ALQ04_02330 [Pseudomonas cichorii]|uniref:Uncharacterized protein n=1 Tax=Pseudomonas cichorii TaxID=36746 RepID=A0A3M4MAL5_PSECI|nr:hypothetical protein [Pseudomonas cichorii]RMQ50101.1 hypothetical protein ALQ04_02330 [Pseudomonas cichorii]